MFGVAIAFCVVWAAALDVHDARRGRVRRSVDQILRIRAEARADSWSTQHSGMPFPIAGEVRDRMAEE
jgi:hypothetical protein